MQTHTVKRSPQTNSGQLLDKVRQALLENDAKADSVQLRAGGSIDELRRTLVSQFGEPSEKDLFLAHQVLHQALNDDTALRQPQAKTFVVNNPI